MIWFKILLIILVAAPFIAIAVVLYLQLIKYVSARNKEDKVRRR